MNPGDRVPELTLVLQDGREQTLSAWRGQWLVLFFYPKDNTPGCTSENLDFSAQREAFAAAGAQVLCVSRDSPRSHRGFCEKQGLRHDLVSDGDEALCRAFDVIKEKSLYGRRYLGIERSTFLIDPAGVLHTAWRGVKVKGHAETVLAALRAAQQ